MSLEGEEINNCGCRNATTVLHCNNCKKTYKFTVPVGEELQVPKCDNCKHRSWYCMAAFCEHGPIIAISKAGGGTIENKRNEFERMFTATKGVGGEEKES